jgi:hypothetical protein
MLNKLCYIFAIVISLYTPVIGATYYVDPITGADSQDGLSTITPWKTIPGTRTLDDTTWLHSSWGSISASNKIQPGDTIYLKAGESITSAIAGKLWIEGTFYSDGTAVAPIEIIVSPSWGSGNFTYNMSGMLGVEFRGMVEVRVSYLNIKGSSASRRFIIDNAPHGNAWGMIIYGTAGDHITGNEFDHLTIRNGGFGGVDIHYADGWTVSNSISHNNGDATHGVGFSVGGISDLLAQNGTFVDSEAYQNGVGSSDIAHGFLLAGGANIRYIRCKAHSNGRDGFDFGTADNDADASATVVDSISYNNSEDGFGINGGTAVSGSNVTGDYINTLSFNNNGSGWHIYDGVTVGIYHSIAHSNGIQSSFGGNVMAYSNAGYNAVNLTLRNNIFYKPKTHVQVYQFGDSGPDPVIDSDYNIYYPRVSNSEDGFEIPWGVTSTYDSPPAFIGANDIVGIDSEQLFKSILSTTDYTLNDYRIYSPSSIAYKAGIDLPGIADAATDKAGRTRADPPEIGLYEFIFKKLITVQ